MAHVLFSFAGWTYEKWMDQQYTDHMCTPYEYNMQLQRQLAMYSIEQYC